MKHALERLRWIYAASLFSKAVTLLNRGVLLPLVAAVLLPAEYASYALLLSAVAFLAGMDVGIGGGTLSKVSAAHARGDAQGIREISRRAYLITLTICVTALGTGLAAHYALGWLQVARMAIDSISPNPRVALTVFSAAIIIQCIFAISTKVLQGISRQAWANLLGGVVNGAYALAIVIFMGVGTGKLGALVGLTLGLAAAAQLLGITISIREVQRLNRGEMSERSDDGEMKLLLSEVVPFGIIALAAFGEREGLKWVLGSAGDLAAVGRYSIYSQLMLTAIGVVQMLLMPYWPMLLNATADRERLSATLKAAGQMALVVCGLMFAAGAAAAVCGFDLALRIWGESYGWTRLEWISFGIYIACSAPKHVLFPLLVGLGGVRRAAVSGAVELTLLCLVIWGTYSNIRLDYLMFWLAGTSALVALPLFVLGIRANARSLLSVA